MRFSKIFILFCLGIFQIPIFSQVSIDYNFLSAEEKEFQYTPIEPEANAVILFDDGNIRFENSKIIITRHIRIKILKKNGLGEANIAIPFYGKKGVEKIDKIKAQTINLGDRGRIDRIKVRESEFFTTDVNKNWQEIRFTFPSVKVGSVIEYKYSKISKDFFSLEKWYFQNDLPTLRSVLNIDHHRNLNYKIIYSGSRLTKKYSNEWRSNWVLENLPSIKYEPFCPNPKDYSEYIQFQLLGYGSGNGYTEVMSNWDNFANEILGGDDFKGVLKKKKSSKKLVQAIIQEGDSDVNKIKKLYTFFQKEINWDGKYRTSPSQKLDKLFKSKIGNSADINLCLVQLLKSAGLDANPVITSTREHGAITKIHPIYNQFNHILAQVKLNGKDVLMDATSKFRPYNLLSKNDLNSHGFLLHKKKSRWINITLPNKTKTIISTDLEFHMNQIRYKVMYSFFGYEALKYRKIFSEEGEVENIISKHFLDSELQSEVELDSFNIRFEKELEKPFAIICYFTKPLDKEFGSELLYFNPFLKKHFNKNPFTYPTRYLPVDFIIPFSEKFIINFFLPKEYELLEIPENKTLFTKSKKGIYSFLFQKTTSQQIQLSSEFTIKDPFIKSSEYGDLREMFNRILGLQKTQLVLKRK